MADEFYLRIRVEAVPPPVERRRVVEQVDPDLPLTFCTFQVMYRKLRRWFFMEFLKGLSLSLSCIENAFL